MRRIRMRSLAVFTAAMVSVALLAAPGAQAQDSDVDGFCGLLTPKEIKAAFGGKVEAEDNFDMCQWWTVSGAFDLILLNAYWNDMTMADTQAFFPDGEELTVGGRPAWYSALDPEGTLFIDVDPGVLVLAASMTPGVDARDGLTQLGKLAVPRAGALPAPPAAPVPESSADALAVAFCELLTQDEVGGALGGPVKAGSFDSASGTCSWVGGGIADFLNLNVSWADQTPEQVQALEDIQTVSVGERSAWYSSAFGIGLLYVELDQGLLVLSAATADDVDPQAALTGLAELVVPRSGSLTGPPAAPSFAPDLGLESLFPTTIGGQPVTIQSAGGESALTGFAGFSAELVAAIEAAVAAQGGSLADVSVAYGFAGGGSSSLWALKLGGMDAAAALSTLLEALGVSQAPGQVAGKTVVDSGSGYYYAKDDVIWLIGAEEPALTEYLSALP